MEIELSKKKNTKKYTIPWVSSCTPVRAAGSMHLDECIWKKGEG